ncbi:MAG TPA: bile acid:sodium symporter, partial [Burkholderiales bacterium]|nr:bile acid:sodium symporter [Burkholderiales bacterium]
AIAGGLLLTAAAPQATISNYYCLLARADIALAVTLTAVSSLLALVSTPLVAGIGFAVLLDTQAGFGLPAGKVMQQVVNGLLLPIAAGMFIRHCAPGFVQRHRLRLRALSLVALAALLTLVLIDQAATIQRHLAMIVTLTTLFTAAAAGIGFGLARGASWSYSDTITMVSAFPARSLSIATLIAVNVLGRVEFLSFAVVFFLVQGVLLAPLMLWARPRAATP